MNNLILLRGLPGAGKSTFADLICNQYIEADMFFKQEGEYKFDPSKLKEAHAWCKDKAESWMRNGYNVCVSNTFTQEWEMKAYYELASKYDYKVFSIIVENRHGNSSVHNVPEETVEKMKTRFEVNL